MVDIGEKQVSHRRAVASGQIHMARETLETLRSGAAAKGDVLAVARVAAIQAAKDTARWIPLCHTLPLDSIEISFELVEGGVVRVTAEARTHARTGVEMEAMTAVSAALLTVYDMLKAVDREMTLGPIRLEEKVGGRSGHWRRESGGPTPDREDPE